VPLGGERAESIRAPERRRIAGVGGVTEGVLAAGTSMAVEGLVSKKNKKITCASVNRCLGTGHPRCVSSRIPFY
jgi:hypothetical protein